jgi:hypothetical protein
MLPFDEALENSIWQQKARLYRALCYETDSEKVDEIKRYQAVVV